MNPEMRPKYYLVCAHNHKCDQRVWLAEALWIIDMHTILTNYLS